MLAAIAAASNNCKWIPAGWLFPSWSINQLGTFSLSTHGWNLGRFLLTWPRFELSMAVLNWIHLEPPPSSEFSSPPPSLLGCLRVARSQPFTSTQKQCQLQVYLLFNCFIRTIELHIKCKSTNTSRVAAF